VLVRVGSHFVAMVRPCLFYMHSPSFLNAYRHIYINLCLAAKLPFPLVLCHTLVLDTACYNRHCIPCVTVHVMPLLSFACTRSTTRMPRATGSCASTLRSGSSSPAAQQAGSSTWRCRHTCTQR
jgi:hypothetical protein